MPSDKQNIKQKKPVPFNTSKDIAFYGKEDPEKAVHVKGDPDGWNINVYHDKD